MEKVKTGCPFPKQNSIAANHRSCLWFSFFFLFYSSGCSFIPTAALETAPQFFTDDFDRESLIVASRRHLTYLQKLPLAEEQFIGKQSFSNRWLVDSLQLFLRIVEKTRHPEQLDARIREHFDIFQAEGRSGAKSGEMLVTGYYEPTFAGSLSRSPDYTIPIYATPGSLITHKNSTTGKTQIGRYTANSKFIPYWTRAEIEKNEVLAGYELTYLHDPLDAFFLHIQGSGRIKLPDGSIRSLHFASSNGHSYSSIGKLLVDSHKLAREEINVPAIRRYLHEHPEEQKAILHHNERFVFFQWGDDSGPQGSLELTLTPGRSIAVDPQSLPVGLPAYLESRRPIIDSTGRITVWTTMKRFVLPQDSGAAIIGPGRVDLFCGNGYEAETTANYLQEQGQLYFLVKKGYRKPKP